MTGIFNVHWTVEAITSPQPWRHCSSCGEARAFRSSGRIRLNANGRKLDAWLIYKCTACDRTWNRPIAERRAVASIAPADLMAMQASDPAWVRARAFDLAALRRHCDRIEQHSDVCVTKVSTGAEAGAWSAVVLTIDAPWPTGQRLDRFLAAELNLSRACLQAMERTGGLQIEPASHAGLKKPVSGRLVVRFAASGLTEAQGAALQAVLLLPIFGGATLPAGPWRTS